MYHGKAGRKLGRTSSHKEAMFRNMVTSVINMNVFARRIQRRKK